MMPAWGQNTPPAGVFSAGTAQYLYTTRCSLWSQDLERTFQPDKACRRWTTPAPQPTTENTTRAKTR